MNVMRFVGRTSRDAMRQVRDALGPDALVLANRPCPEGVELLAAAPGSLAMPASPEAGAGPAASAERAPASRGAAAAPGREPPPAAGMSTVSFQDYVRQRLRERHRGQGGGTTRPPAEPVAPLAAPARPDAPPAPPFDMPAHASAGPGQDALVAELQSLKASISRQFATMSWFEGVRRSPVQGRLLRTMVAAGFSLKLARSVVSRLPSDYGERDAQVWLEDVLARNLRCVRPGETFSAGGVFALVGPTGVGKTTTTAKIAARHVLEHGPQSVTLITVDTYRLGAHDQLRAFGRILGVPVHVAHDASALHDLLRLRGSHQLVLVDTVGLGHRDERIGSLLMSLPRGDVRHVVVASCAAQSESIDQSLRAYEVRQAVGVVLTKTDEAARLGGALDCLLRLRAPLLGVCDGQRVPEDWHAPEPAALVRRALLAPPAGAFALDDEELPLVFGVAATLQGDPAHA
jgi:flagellar biosynthesis protein FlhF